MTKSRMLLTLFAGVLTVTLAFGQQMSKAELKAYKKEMKEWKKRKKKMSIEDFKALIEEQIALKAAAAAAIGDIESLEDQVAAKDAQIGESQKQITRMQATHQATVRELENLKNNPPQTSYNPELINGEDFSVGVVFKVQVGAFRKMDLKKYADSSKDFSEEGADDLRKYVIGNFRNYEDANVLKRYLREMGVDDAWIVPYRDGKRVPLREVVSETKEN